MKTNQEVQMYHLVLHELAERNERLWEWVDVVPHGSLLVWLDNWMDKPDTRRDQVAGRQVDLLGADHLVVARNSDLLKRIHLKQFDDGWHAPKNSPQKHGDFSEFTFWREAF